MVDADIELLLVRIDGEEKLLTREDFDDERSSLGPARVVEVDVVCPKGDLLNITAQEAFDFGFSDGTPESLVPLCARAGSRAMGEACDSGRQCDSGLCDTSGYCTRLCSDDGLCPSDMDCEPISGFAISICRR